MGFVHIDLDKKKEQGPIDWAHIEEKKNELPFDIESWENHFETNEPTYSCFSNENVGKIIWCAMHISEYAGCISRDTMRPIDSGMIMKDRVKDDMAVMLYFMHMLAQELDEDTIIDIMERTQAMVDKDDSRLE